MCPVSHVNDISLTMHIRLICEDLKIQTIFLTCKLSKHSNIKIPSSFAIKAICFSQEVFSPPGTGVFKSRQRNKQTTDRHCNLYMNQPKG